MHDLNLLSFVFLIRQKEGRKSKVVGGKWLELIEKNGLDVGLKEVWSQMYPI